MKRALFRVDANSKIGLGHLSRCITLADELYESGMEVEFVCKNYDGFPIEKLTKYKTKLLKTYGDLDTSKRFLDVSEQNDAVDTQEVMDGIYDLIIVDHYGIGINWEVIINPYARKLLVIDDLANRKHSCDYLLDTLPNRKREDYANFVDPNTVLLLGSSYSLLRNEFHQRREKSKYRRSKLDAVSSILVSFGGGNNYPLISSIVNKVLDCGFKGRIDIVMPSNSNALESFSSAGNITVHHNCNNVGELMLGSDLAIGSLGVSSLERCCLGLPSLSIILADNQMEMAKYLSDLGAVELIESNVEVNKLSALIYMNKNKLSEMSKLSFDVCDGLGVDRVLNKLIDRSLNISIREVNERDVDILFDWQIEPGNRNFSRNTEVPSRKDHEVWFSKMLLSKKTRLWIIEFKSNACGYVRLDDKGCIEEVSIMISKEYRGLNLAKEALLVISKKSLYGTIIAEIDPGNQPSMKSFFAAGYTKKSEREYFWSED